MDDIVVATAPAPPKADRLENTYVRANNTFSLPSLPQQNAAEEDHLGFYSFKTPKEDPDDESGKKKVFRNRSRVWTEKTAKTQQLVIHPSFPMVVSRLVTEHTREVPQEYNKRSQLINEELHGWSDIMDAVEEAGKAFQEELHRRFEFDEQWEREAIERDAEVHYSDLCWESFASVYINACERDERLQRNDIVMQWTVKAVMQLPYEHWLHRTAVETEESNEWEEAIVKEWKSTMRIPYITHRHQYTRKRLVLYETDARERLVQSKHTERRRALLCEEEGNGRRQMTLEHHEQRQYLLLNAVSTLKYQMLVEHALPDDLPSVTEQLNMAAEKIQSRFKGFAVRRNAKKKNNQEEKDSETKRIQDQTTRPSIPAATAAAAAQPQQTADGE